MADWCDLPGSAVVLIGRGIQVIEDFIAFRSTCSSWRQATTLKDFYTSSSSSSSPNLPLLMLTHFERRDVPDDQRKLLSLSKGKTCSFSFPEAKGMEYRGSKGWLIMVQHSTGKTCLFHPISRVYIPLPNVPFQINSYGWMIKSVALSATPSDDASDYVVMVVFMEETRTSPTTSVLRTYTGIWRPGDLTWTEVDIPYWVENLNYYNNGRFYALTIHGEVWMCDVSGPDPKASKIVKLPEKPLRPHAQLVECGGRLLIVAPYCQYHHDMSYIHDLLMVEIDVIKGSYNTITSLGSSSVFLGRNEGFSIDANKFPGIIQPNSIYFSNGKCQVAMPGPYDTKNYGSGVWFNF